MGKFLDLHEHDGIITPEIDKFLEGKGFCECLYLRNTWIHGYHTDGGTYYYRVTISKKEVQIDLEYDCGGYVNDWTFEIQPKDIESLEAFIEFMDEAYEVIEL